MASKPRHSRSDRDQLILFGLARGLSHDDVAELAGCSSRTVSRRLEGEDGKAFRSRVLQVRAELRNQTAGLLVDASAEAVRCLRQLLKCKSPVVRLGAAKAILSETMKVAEAIEVEQRLGELEQRLEQVLAAGTLHRTNGRPLRATRR